MEKKLDRWNEIAELIHKEKQTALGDFRRHHLEPVDRPARGPMPLFSKRPVWRPVLTAVAAAILLVAGLIYFQIVNGRWRSVPSARSAPALEQLLADSLLYSQAGMPDKDTSVLPSIPASNPLFTAWAEVGLTIDPVDVAADPSASVEHGDPEEVRRRIGRAIQKGVFERLLSFWQEFQKKEA